MRASIPERLPAARLVPLPSWTEETMTKICSAALFLCIAGPTLADPPTEVMNIMRGAGPQVHAEQGDPRCLAGGDLGQSGEAGRDVRRAQPLLAGRLQPAALSSGDALHHGAQRHLVGRLGPQVR